MTPAKNRERKCSTCKHYQPSPLWRKGWCRNPLLYDRNTNHLVEGESLACNRTFIDYWEPLESPALTGPVARSNREKPRVAPSIPMSPVDARGNPIQTPKHGHTPVSGSAAIAPAQVIELQTTKEKPPLSLVQRTNDHEVDPYYGEQGAPEHLAQEAPAADVPPPGTTRQRIRAARAQAKPGSLRSRIPLSGMRLWIPLGVLIALLAAGGGGYLLSQQKKVPVVVPTVMPTRPAATPTGFGDATSTLPPVPPTVPRPVAAVPSAVAVNTYVQVSGSKSGLTVRSAPSRSGTRLRILTDGTKAHVIDGPQTADGYTWWKIDSFDPAQPSLSGWCVSNFLVPVAAPSP